MTSPTSRRTLLQGGAAALASITARRAARDHARPAATASGDAAPVVTAATAGVTSASISWGSPAQGTVTGYQVSRNGIDSHGAGPWSTTVSAGTLTKTFSNLVPGSTYILSVAAIMPGGLLSAVARASVAIPIAGPQPQGLSGNWKLLSTGPSLSALAGSLFAPVAVEMDADLGNCAVWLADPGTAPPATARTVVHGKNLSSGRHVYGLHWIAGAIGVYMDGTRIQSMPVDITAANKTLVVVGAPKAVYRASAYDPA